MKNGAGSALPQDVAAIAPEMAPSPARFDKVYGYKGWDFPFPSFGDSLLQDYGGFRSTLAKYGFGFLAYDVTIGSVNMLNTPTNGPGPSNATLSNPNAPPSRQQYWGQRPAILNGLDPYLTYDLSQYGVPDGQIAIAATYSWSSWQHYFADKLTLNGLTWYQTLFNKAVEVKLGYIANGDEWIGTFVGGNIASPFGPSAFIPYAMGLSQSPAVQPTAWVKWHMTDNLYDQFGVMRSMGINGPTGDIFYDDAHYNPTGFNFTEPNGRLLGMNELGYHSQPAPDSPSTWVRVDTMYNTSKFANYQTGGSTTGVGSIMFLADRQIFQAAPHSPFTAYRGIYAGVSAMYAPPQTNVYSQYYEGRLYAVGLFDARPTDMTSLVFSHNVFSHYVTDLTNEYAAVTGISAHNASNTITLSYTAHLMPGIYGTAGVAYTDHPSLTYVPKDGSSLSFLYSMFTVF